MLILVYEVIVNVQPTKHTFEIGIFFRVLAHCGEHTFPFEYLKSWQFSW